MKYLLKTTDPDFFIGLRRVLQFIRMEKLVMAVPVKNFICKNWNCYFDLHNPENFDNPEGVKEWHNNSKCYDYYEKPYWDPLILNIWSDVEDEGFSALQNLIENAAAYEEKILIFLSTTPLGMVVPMQQGFILIMRSKLSNVTKNNNGPGKNF